MMDQSRERGLDRPTMLLLKDEYQSSESTRVECRTGPFEQTEGGETQSLETKRDLLASPRCECLLD